MALGAGDAPGDGTAGTPGALPGAKVLGATAADSLAADGVGAGDDALGGDGGCVAAAGALTGATFADGAGLAAGAGGFAGGGAVTLGAGGGVGIVFLCNGGNLFASD